MSKKFKYLWLILFAFLWVFPIEQTMAISLQNNPYVTFSPDGYAFTTNAGDKSAIWYQDGHKVVTGVTSSLRELKEGEHYYATDRHDIIPVGSWEVVHTAGACIHNSYTKEPMYHGIVFGRQKCLQYHYSGWVPTCADCGAQVVSNLFYMSEVAAKSITDLDMKLDYYYLCPWCTNLEQGVGLQKHVCKDVSANQYSVRYHANFGSGYMPKSVHMYNDEIMYEGQKIVPQRNLNKNTYRRVGYIFSGWNTKQDGSGEYFADGALIKNLTSEEQGTVILYAQWKRCQSTLQVDPAEGSYDGSKEMVSFVGNYGTEKPLSKEKVIPPTGYQVTFESMGGETVAPIISTKSFYQFALDSPAAGILRDDCYEYLGEDGSVDRVTILYNNDAITLPSAKKEGYSFGGWYMDKGCTKPVGASGASYTPSKDTTLYACWVTLKLESQDNYSAHGGKGAVDLSWEQADTLGKTYKVYQKEEQKDFQLIHSTTEVGTDVTVDVTYGMMESTEYFEVPYSGYYRITLGGAGGGNYGAYSGGLGGQVTALMYLSKGTRFQIMVGGQNGYGGGGQGSAYACGGGYSALVTSDDRYLLIAGGGGGATIMGDGLPGGSTSNTGDCMDGESGMSGGGGGYYGGNCGEVIVHNHESACRHVHSGNSAVYGGCYTSRTSCGYTGFRSEVESEHFYYGNKDDNGNHVFCGRCGSYDCPGHRDTTYRYVCNRCGASYSDRPSYCTNFSRYALGCGRDESYICGMTEGQVIKAFPAYGGSNYVEKGECIQYEEQVGTVEGDGFVIIQAVSIGFVDGNNLYGVQAYDKATPERIAENSVLREAVNDRDVLVSFEKPKDTGTVYYHMVESYDLKTETLMCRSNQTENNLITGVVGYYYVIDNVKNTDVSKEDTWYSEKGDNPHIPVLDVKSDTFLHVAAIDGAGNIGKTLHISVGTLDAINWPIGTEPIQIEMGRNVSVCEEENTYYVRADGSTPVELAFRSNLYGVARPDYQIDQAILCVQKDEIEVAKRIIGVEKEDSVEEGEHLYVAEEMWKTYQGEFPLEDYPYVSALRNNYCKSLWVSQRLCIPNGLNGEKIYLYPQAAITQGNTVFSDREEDYSNGITLIADGQGPHIYGVEVVEELKLWKPGEINQCDVQLRAEDLGSGLEEFYVEIQNLDNGISETIVDEDGDGTISFTMSSEDALFVGEISILAVATDKVGNTGSEGVGNSGYWLEAYVERILVPHTPTFKRGESGIIFVEAGGYVDSIQIRFPETLSSIDAGLNMTYHYAVPEYLKKEEYIFMVPLDAPDGEYQIWVRGFKDGIELEDCSKVLTITISGSVLDDLRTRLR